MTRIEPGPAAPFDEGARLAALAALGILDTPPERAFDTIVQAAQRLIGCKMATLSLIDDHRSWFKAKCGVDADAAPREMAFCDHVVAADAMLVVPDALADARFARHPMVTGAPYVRFYAGVPIHAPASGGKAPLPLGALCMVDDRPRAPTPADLAALADLGDLAEAILTSRRVALEATRVAEEQRRAMNELDRAQRQFRQAERMADIGSWRLTLADNRPIWSDHTYAIHEMERGHPVALDKALDCYPPHARPMIEAAVAHTIETGTPFDVEADFVTARGNARRVRSMGELEMEDGRPIALIGVFQDITGRHALEQALRHIANTDELTRIASRTRFNQFVDESIARAQARNEPLALLLIDLDRFKAVNDRCGHAAGDDLLRLMAGRLQAPYLADSFAARLGGDEFVLLVTDARVLADLPGAIRRLLADLRHDVPADGGAIAVSATIGGCWLGGAVQNRRDLLQEADAALYRAKRSERGSAVIDGMGAAIRV